MKSRLSLLLVGVIGALALSSCKTRSVHDFDFEAMVELSGAIRAYEKEFGGMDAMHPKEMMFSLSGKNPRNVSFYNFERDESTIKFIDGEFASKSGRIITVFFSPEKILIAVSDSSADATMLSKREIKSIVVRRQ